MNLLLKLILAIAFLVATDSQGGECGVYPGYGDSCGTFVIPCINGLLCSSWWGGHCVIDSSIDFPGDAGYTGCAWQAECPYGYYCDQDHCTPCDMCDSFWGHPCVAGHD
eukprot:120016_1